MSPVFGAVGAAVFIAAWLAPNHYLPWLSFHAEACMFASLIGFCLALVLQKSVVLLDKALLLLAGIILIVWIQWAAGQIGYRGDATVSTLYLVGLALAWWLGSNSAHDLKQANKALTWLAALFAAAALISVWIAVLQWLNLGGSFGIFATEHDPTAARPFGNLGQPNHFATFMLMATVLSCALHVQRRIRKWQWIALVLVLSFGFVMAESRAGWLSVLAVSLLFLWRGDRAWGLGGWKIIASWWAVLLLLAGAWRPLNQALLLAPTRTGAWGQDGIRAVIWRQMLAGLEQSPWVGYGWRQTIAGQKAGANFVASMYLTDYAHSVVLDLLLWLGIPLGLLLMAAIVVWLVRAARRIDGSSQLILLAAVVPFAIHSLVEFPFVYAYFLFPVGWMLGALSALQSPSSAQFWQMRSRRARLAGAGWILLFATVCGWVALEYLAAEEDHRVMRFEMRQLGQTPAGYEPPRLVLLDQLGEMLKLARLEPYPGMPSRDIERMRVANASFEWATLQLKYAVALGLNGQPQEASRQLKNLRSLYGEQSYAQARQMLLALRREKYPQLESVQLP